VKGDFHAPFCGSPVTSGLPVGYPTPGYPAIQSDLHRKERDRLLGKKRGIFSMEFKEEAARMVVETSLYRPRRP
jgi:hypothetical protein